MSVSLRFARLLACIAALGMFLLIAFFPSLAQADELPLHTGQADLTIVDTNQELDAAAQADLATFVKNTPLPAVIEHVVVLTFPNGGDPFNDYVAGKLRTEHPELLNNSLNTFKDHSILFAFSMPDRYFGVYSSHDVDEVIRNTDEIDYYLDPMKPLLRENNITGAVKVALLASQQPPEPTDMTLLLTVAGVVTAAGVGTAGTLTVRHITKEARRRYETIRAGYATIVEKLPATNVYAHSTTNVLVDAELRSQWDTVRENFEASHEKFQRLPELSTNKDFRKHARLIGQIHKDVEHAITAIDNIATLHDFDAGDVQTRRKILSELRTDIEQAVLSRKSEAYRDELHELERQIKDALLHPDASDVVAIYAEILRKYQGIVTAIARQEVTDIDPQEYPPTAIWDSRWRPGYGYYGYVPYVSLNSWQTEQHEIRSSSSSSSTGFSGGFSGGGGSSRF